MIFKKESSTQAAALSLADWLERLSQIPETIWARHLFVATLKDRGWAVPAEAIEEAFQAATRIRQELHDLPDLSHDPTSYLLQQGITMADEPASFLDELFIHFATSLPKDKQILFSVSSLERVQQSLAQASMPFEITKVNLKSLVLWHEYYHHLIFQKGKAMKSWTRSEMILEEIGALYFSRLMMNLSFSPQIFTWLLLYTIQPAEAMVVGQALLEMDVRTYG